MIAIVDYGVGNLFSLRSSLAAIGAEAVVSGNAAVLHNADKIILPGVGAFSDAADKLHQSSLADVIRSEAANGKPLLGICLGMQLLFEKSYEYGEHEGLSLLKGRILPISSVVDPSVKIPHMGWNALHFVKPEHPLFKYLSEGDAMYFVHSYYAADCADSLIATAEYTAELTAACALKNVMGCQFHPEKSGSKGLSILRAFAETEVFP